MRHKFFYSFVALAIFVFTSCSSSGLDTTNDGDTTSVGGSVSDPEGTVMVNLLADGAGVSVGPIQGYMNSGTGWVLAPTNLAIVLKRDGNLVMYDYQYSGEIASVGAVKGLGNITNIPQTGYAEAAYAMKGYGYIGHGQDWVESLGPKPYVRIYVDDVTYASNGLPQSVRIKYQFPYYKAE